MDVNRKIGRVKKQIAALFPRRRVSSHKGDYGHLLIIGGSRNLAGSIILAGRAALRSGIGLITLAMPSSLKTIVSCAVPEAMSLPLLEDENAAITHRSREHILAYIRARGVTAVACGIGLTTHSGAQKLVEYLIAHLDVPFLVDADGLNCLKGKINLLAQKHSPCIITPHPKEMSRLSGIAVAAIQKKRRAVARAIAKKSRCIVVLKGHETVVTNGKEIFLNPTGNPGMATGGTGDVLTGITGAFLAQGITPLAAAKAGVFIHGLAGDIVKKKKTEMSLIASDVIENLPQAFKEIGIE
jgi:NAD(P)H-hydrate epimerase